VVGDEATDRMQINWRCPDANSIEPV